ncbi:hypothetical protein Phi19:3_gp061 [Cellulophaga phage phi19:3]|uniref:Uncharacterized protein n=1 Tax=Cellulophaga phage phi19:3 TaxID=1327971 RepID=R9ZY72_9CAUD|nr:hypothetical protein Phi19:3_gp061 [Cellulophaga phage phi19:3]AGO47465.1 hypothetical protein Phi19:3_gp061 [Cellulophaga phage phi19:3]
MNANELRKGIYVRDRSGKEMLIDFIDMPNNKVGMNMLVMGIPVHPLTEFIDYLQPIPLTEEWLLKFGFVKNDWTDGGTIIYYGWQNGAVLLETDSNSSFFILDGKHEEFNNIKHVHQLQNLYFALTGEELTTKK